MSSTGLKMTKAEREQKRVERLLPQARELMLEIWGNPNKHQDQASLAKHFGLSDSKIQEVLLVALDYVVPEGHWIESKPYRVVTRTPSVTFSRKIGYLTQDMRSLQRTAKSLACKDNPDILKQGLQEQIAGAAMILSGTKINTELAFDEIIKAEQKEALIAELRKQVAEADRELESLN